MGYRNRVLSSLTDAHEATRYALAAMGDVPDANACFEQMVVALQHLGSAMAELTDSCGPLVRDSTARLTRIRELLDEPRPLEWDEGACVADIQAIVDGDEPNG
jgi:hypothetical protein